LMQVEQLDRAIRLTSNENPVGGDLDLLLVYNGGRGRSKVTEEEAEHLQALQFIKRSLAKFDLSKNEVRVYLFLARFGAHKAQRIAETLGVHRTEAYKILHRLEKQGLIQCVFERPMKFTALPFEKVLENLIEERRHRIHRLEQRKKELLDLWLSLPEPEDVKTRRETFQVLEGRRQISVKATEFLQECEGELLLAVPDNNLLWLYNSPFFDDLEKIERKRKLDVRILTNFSPTSTYVLEQINMDDKDFTYLDEETPGFIISDGSHMILLMDRSKDGGRKPLALWTNYKSIVKAFRLLFTQLWAKEQATSYIEIAKTGPRAR